MKISDLIEILYSANEDEVMIDVDDTIYDFELGHEEEQFDGFDTVHPAILTLKPKKN